MLRFKERLISRRNQLGWTQIHLAQNSGVSPRAIADYESGKGSSPSLATVEKLALALRLNPLWLLGATDMSLAPSPLAPNEVQAKKLLALLELVERDLAAVRRQAEKLMPVRLTRTNSDDVENQGVPHKMNLAA